MVGTGNHSKETPAARAMMETNVRALTDLALARLLIDQSTPWVHALVVAEITRRQANLEAEARALSMTAAAETTTLADAYRDPSPRMAEAPKDHPAPARKGFYVEGWKGSECVGWSYVAHPATAIKRAEGLNVDQGATAIY